MRVPYPRLEVVRRRRPGQLAPGDSAVAGATTALIDLIGDLAASGVRDAAGYSLKHFQPLQMGGTCCEALLIPTITAPDEAWVAYQLDAKWLQFPSRNETLRTAVRAEYVSPAIAWFSMTSRAGNGICAEGRTRYVRVRNGVNLATNSAVVRPGESSRLTTADAAVHPVVYKYSSFLVDLLMNPAMGRGEPLGRRLHPLSSIPFSAAVFQAIEVIPEKCVASATMKFVWPMPTNEGFETRTVMDAGGLVTVSFVSESGIPFANCRITA